MKVSFLVTYYNQKEYVQQSMDSILAVDKPRDWEILVGDDGSSDGTVEEVSKYIKRYPNNIKIYVMPRVIGNKYDPVRRASANRLNILEHSTGDIFCVLDGDDFFCDEGFLKEAVDIFKNNKEVSIVSFGFKHITDGIFGEDIILPAATSNKCVDKKTYLEHFYIHVGGCVYRKNFDNERIKYIRNIGFFDDNNIVVNNLNYGEMFAVNRPIYAYRQTGQSLFTSMGDAEQSVLNVQGMDVDLRLVGDELKNSIKKRYASSVILMYIWRYEIPKIIGEEKCRRYEDGCKDLMPSFCYDLMHYDDATKDRKKEIMSILCLKKIYTLKQYIRYCLRGIVK